MSDARTNPSDSSIARRLPGFDARHATQRARRFRGLTFLLVVAIVVAVVGAFLGGYFSGSARDHGAPRGPAATSGAGSANTNPSAGDAGPALTVSLFASKLAAPISGASVVPGPGTLLVIAGGATSAGALAPGVFTFDTSTGKLLHVGNLTGGIQDAAMAVISGQDVVFGGSSPSALTTVQALAAPGPTGSPGGAGTVPTAGPIGALPEPRADFSAVTIGATTYLVGGDDGTTPQRSVLATKDGRSFSMVANLLKPVRFPAVAAVGATLYIFGGETTSGPGTWSPVDSIQSLDTKTHRVRSIGHLPLALSQAAAVTLGKEVILIGGVSSTSGTAASTNGAIWAFSPRTGKISTKAQLPQPVAQAGVAVAGSTIWVIGGVSNSAPVSAIQTVSSATATGH